MTDTSRKLANENPYLEKISLSPDLNHESQEFFIDFVRKANKNGLNGIKIDDLRFTPPKKGGTPDLPCSAIPTHLRWKQYAD